jgi:hypothetical protein
LPTLLRETYCNAFAAKVLNSRLTALMFANGSARA